MSVLSEIFRNLTLTQLKIPLKLSQSQFVPVRHKVKDRKHFTLLPLPGVGISYRRRIHYPEEYTVEPLKTTHLAGRDPVTGRKVVQGLGGGIKHLYHWIKWDRDGPAKGPPQEEKVIRIIKCGCRTANVALVAFGDKMKYILATENMKPGDIIKTSKFIPRIPVKPNEGDAYPLGALPVGTMVHNIQVHPSSNKTLIHSAGCSATIKRIVDGKALVQLPSKQEKFFELECMATVGKLSNAEHSSIPIGSAQKARELGYRPRSGLWHRKTGVHGRKIKPIKPPSYSAPLKETQEYLRLTLPNICI